MNDDQFRRYSRHILLSEIDEAGQNRLIQSHALILGLGGLGSCAAMYLSSSGIGKLTLCDFDEVSLSNLQRQIIHSTESIGDKKVLSAKKQLQKLNPETNIQTYECRLTEPELLQLIEATDIVIDASDNFPTRYLLNHLCQKTLTPLISGAAIQYQGHVTTFTQHPLSPCYNCLYPDAENTEESDTCNQLGVLAPLTGIIGSLQATEAIKVLAQFGEPLSGKLLTLDALTMKLKTRTFSRDPNCSVCH